MRVLRLGSITALVAASLTACTAQQLPHPDTSTGSTNMQAAPPTQQDQGWAALVEADREMRDLANVRDATPDLATRNGIELQMMELRARSDKLLDDMSIGDGRVHDAAIRADVSNLHRAMNSDAATEMQGQTPLQR